jgi:hypothetical protein
MTEISHIIAHTLFLNARFYAAPQLPAKQQVVVMFLRKPYQAYIPADGFLLHCIILNSDTKTKRLIFAKIQKAIYKCFKRII